ncbi:MAG: hypothetical protein LBK41_07085 [Clostridiales bacterium]|nr:hypothetical protein [Clostridiales bacterium]
MKRWYKSALFLAAPSVFAFLMFVVGAALEGMSSNSPAVTPLALLGFIYLLSALYAYIFARFRLDRIALLPISFWVSPVGVFIWDTVSPGAFRGMVPQLTVFYYAVPFTAITAAAAIIITFGREPSQKGGD